MANSWRRSGQANRQSQQNQDRTPGTNTPTKDGGRQQAAAALSGNAWGAGKGKAAVGGGASQSPVQADSHVPVKDFNAAEVKEFLKKSTSTGHVPVHGRSQELQYALCKLRSS